MSSGRQLFVLLLMIFVAAEVASQSGSNVVLLERLNGETGYRVYSDIEGGALGGTASGAGDVNGDGIDDYLLGLSPAGQEGAVYLIYGSSKEPPDTVRVPEAINGTNGIELVADSLLFIGSCVGSAGDLNDDGLADFVIGAYDGRGAVFVVFGRSEPYPELFNLDDLDGSDGFLFEGLVPDERVGNDCGSWGDLNGDGLDDLVIGVLQRDSNEPTPGNAYVLFGRSDPWPSSLLSSELDGSNGFALAGVEGEHLVGSLAVGLEDFNGDGLADLVTTGEDAEREDEVYVLLGSEDPWPPVVFVDELDGSNGFTLFSSEAGTTPDHGLGSADLNGDGLSDLVIGDPNVFSEGGAYVLFGSDAAFPTRFDLFDLDGSNGFRIEGETGSSTNPEFGRKISSGGDFNQDGIEDILIGAPGTSAGDPGNPLIYGAAFLIFGHPGPYPAVVSLDTLAPERRIKFSGAWPFGVDLKEVGAAVFGGQDFDGDGVPDLILGAPSGGPFGGSGIVYVIRSREGVAIRGSIPP